MSRRQTPREKGCSKCGAKPADKLSPRMQAITKETQALCADHRLLIMMGRS